MNNQSLKICKKCLLRDLDKNEYFKSVQAAIDAIDDSLRADPEVYEERLSACRMCDKLADGLCGVCGCYVELRAAKAGAYCPAVHPKW